MQNQPDNTPKTLEEDTNFVKESYLKTLNVTKITISFMQALGIAIIPIAMAVFCMMYITRYRAFYLDTSFTVLVISSLYCMITTIGMAIVKLLIMIAEKPKFSLKNFLKNNLELCFLFLALLYTIISTLVQYFTNFYLINDRDVLIWGTNYNNEGIITILLYSVLFIACYTLNNDTHKKIVLASIIFAAIVVGATMLGILTSGAHLDNDWLSQKLITGVFNNSNHNGYFMCVSAVLSAMLTIYSKKPILTIFWTITYIVSSICLLLSQCLGGHIGLVLGLSFMVIVTFLTNRKYSNKIIMVLALGIVIFAVFELTDLSIIFDDYTNIIAGLFNISQDASSDAAGAAGSGRWRLWRGTLDVIGQSPWIGKGLDCYYGYNAYNPSLDMPHNEYIQLASNVGIPVLILYLAAILTAFFRGLKLRKSVTEMELIGLVTAFTYCVSAFFGNTFTYTYPFFIILFAFGIPRKKQGKYDLLELK